MVWAEIKTGNEYQLHQIRGNEAVTRVSSAGTAALYGVVTYKTLANGTR